MEVEVKNFEIVRLGNQIRDDKPRPLKLELRNEAEKFVILRKAANIRKTENEKLKKVIISTDMTLKQREIDKILREELKRRRLAGEKNIKIKDGKIVTKIEGGGNNQG